MLKSNAHPSGLDIFVDHTGVDRVLAKLPPQEHKRKALRAFSSVYPLIPRSQWQPISRRESMGGQFILDQKSHGSCVGFSAAEALMRSRFIRGYGFQKLSGSYIYSWINGGGDNGAQITDSLKALEDHGTCLEVTCGWNDIYRNATKRGDTEAQRFKLREGIVISTFDEAGTAIQMNLIAQFAIEVGNNFDSFDSNGVAGFSNGPGNHSVHADGMKLISSGVWVLDMPNSWSTQWGDTGRCYLSEKHFSSVDQDAYTHLDQDQDPNDSDNPTLPVS